MIIIGTSCQMEMLVTEEFTAAHVNPELMPVFGSPYMVGLAENAAHTVLSCFLDEDQTSVGLSMEFEHISPTPIGVKIFVEAEITNVSENSKRVEFKWKAWDEKCDIAHGTHLRAIVNKEKFMSRANLKLDPNL